MVDRRLAKADYVGSIPIICSKELRMEPIKCDCSECNPERTRLWEETHKYLRTIPGFAEYDWEDLERRDREVRAHEREDVLRKTSATYRA